MLGVLSGDPATLTLEEAHRFEHEPLWTPAGLVWDLTTLWRELLTGVRKGATTARQASVPLRSIGVDTWAVDWALVSPGGDLLGLPRCYRDPRHALARDRFLKEYPGGVEGLYERIGIQPQPFNTLFQLVARRESSPALFASAPAGTKIALLPDLLHDWLGGRLACERTNASSTNLLDPLTGDWDRALFASLGLAADLLPDLVDPGTVLGPIRPELAALLDLSAEVQIVAPATHDTASAVAAAPALNADPGTWAYLSSGTWSLLGVELDKPLTSPAAFAVPFTNERGVGGQTRFLRNIGGLWLLQELRRDLRQAGETYSFAELAELARSAEPLRTVIDPNAAVLAEPGDAMRKLRALASAAGEPVPESAGQLARCCLESLALCYAQTIDLIETLTPARIETLLVFGGGVKNELLNELTAAAIGRPVMLGPSEATAIGNLLVQAQGLGLIESLQAIRAIVERSFPSRRVQPLASEAWRAAHSRYELIVGAAAPTST
ncbi:Rhamnulokinase [Botrimarina hoheduenensis]|uniref:Rhamnulokinase n=2 Tax=Botrimarina hoheduenensis TaxID=2528000 RepID=A0A5C5VXM4_9BACT|nr:Rhamnulokinase [Botrimarina hoheduenensis]